MLDPSTIRLVAGVLTAALAALLLLVFRWERAGGPLPLRASTPVPRGVGVAWPLVQMAVLLYPLLVTLAPHQTYGTPLTFSFPFDGAVQILGLLLWGGGAVLLLWCSRLLGPIMNTDGVVEGHRLVTEGPYAAVRHPTYTGFILMAFGTAGLFLSYALLPVAFLAAGLAHTLARGEEALLASPRGFGEAYRAYMRGTGRFLPRVAVPRSPSRTGR